MFRGTVKPAHVEEMERRDQQRFERLRKGLGAGNMNDTKWRELFKIIPRCAPPDLCVRMKMIGSEHVTVDCWYHVVNRQWTDSFYGPFQHRDVEWLEVRGPKAGEVRSAIERLGKMLLVACDGGFKVVGYGSVVLSER